MSKDQDLNGADFLLLLLYLNEREPIKGSVRLMKMIFIFMQEVVPMLKKKGIAFSEDALPEFSAYNYGPFSRDVYEQVELFKNIGFISVRNLKANEEMEEADDWEEQSFVDEMDSQGRFTNNTDGKFMCYSILAFGASYVEKEIRNKLVEGEEELLSAFKSRITNTSIKSLLRYVYTKYPEMTANSLIKDEVLNS